MSRLITGWVLLGATILGGCASGSAEINNSVPETALSINTVFGWIETTEMTVDNGAYTTKPLEKKHVGFVGSGASFDSTEDLYFMSADDLNTIQQEHYRNGSVAIFIGDQAKVTVGTTYKSTDADAPFQAELHFGRIELENGDEFKPRNPVGDKVTSTLTVKKLGGKRGEEFEATVKFTFEKGENDATGVRTGEVEVTLSGELVNEQLGNSNANILF